MFKNFISKLPFGDAFLRRRAQTKAPFTLDASDLRLRAQELRRDGDREGAITLLNTVLANDAKNILALKDLANIKFEVSDYVGVGDALEQVQSLELLGEFSAVLYARSALRLKDAQKALELLEPVSQRAQPSGPAMYHFIEALVRLKKFDRSAEELDQFAIKCGEDSKRRLLLARACLFALDYSRAYENFLLCEKDGILTDADIVSYARSALRIGQASRAVNILSQVSSFEHLSISQLSLSHEAYLKNGDVQDAQKLSDEILNRSVATSGEAIVQGRFLRSHGDFELASRAFERALDMGADEIVISQELAELDLKQGLLTKAEGRLVPLTNAYPDDARSHFILARVLVKQARFSEARSEFVKVIELKPLQASAYRELAMICTHSNQQEEAIDLLHKALELQPHSGSLNAEVASIYLERGQFDDARKHAELALEYEVENVRARGILTNLSLFSEGTGNRPSASVFCKKARKDFFLSLDLSLQIFPLENADLAHMVKCADTEWILIDDEHLSESKYRHAIGLLWGGVGSTVYSQSEILAVRSKFVRDILKAFDGSSLTDMQLRKVVAEKGREIYSSTNSSETDEFKHPVESRGVVLLISSSGRNLFGGAEHFLRGLAMLYSEMGFSPILIGHRGIETVEGITEDGYPFVEFPTDSIDEFRAFLLTRDVVLAHAVTGSGMFLLQSVQDIDIPVVYGTHFWREMLLGSGWFADIDRLAAPKRDFKSLTLRYEAVYANSIYTRNMQYEHHQVASSVMYSLPSTETIPAQIDNRDFVLLVNARPEKGFELLLEVAKMCPDLQFVAIASQSTKEEALAAVTELGLKNVKILERVSDLSSLYQRALCVMVPSYRFIETFSRVVIEAHRFGVPVIGSDRGNVPLLLAEAGVSLPEKAQDWAVEIQRLADDHDYWKKRSALASENSVRYSFDKQKPVLTNLVKQAQRPVLIAVGNGIGNIIQCTPAIRRLSEYLGQPVDVVINQDFPGCEWLLTGSPHVGMVFASEIECIKRRYDLVIVLASFGKTVPRFNAKRTFVARHKLPFELTNNMHEAKYNLDCLEAADIGLSYDDEDVAKYFVGDRKPTGLNGRKIILHAGGKAGEWEVKRWPHFEKLADRLLKDGWNVVSVGGPEEYVAGTVDRTGTPLDESLETIQDAAYVVANDSGLMHVADALEIPLTTIFGPTSVVKNGPLSADSRVVELDKECAPCQFNEKFKTCNCIREIQFDDVYNSISCHLAKLYANNSV